ncbi:LysE family transporter [Clostridium beijerinckii]|uniref:Lysine transporter LysE n=1 Tax=Clostridium beijerinckii TaxID=1520 RepID=A0A1S9N4F0_CLOBE|nr:LysE family transporter [Clostridium beijerinckii]MZK51442.1 LysE family transporter [Clostridium beijerinckii]MZK59642.1 LysE family transporter [Clostridium beijerinckii]MZK69762.1 LysE family transporter [Clostridium beijerinckii]MZK75140.1 LysE family transporter [Clostridium beijerinckii]MZK84852.1 LysE family transporter [Clostridium beijerinckii]
MFNLSALLSYVLVSTFTPGPNNIMSMTNGTNFGYKKTFKFVLGATTGMALIMLLCGYLNLFLFKLLPNIKLSMEVFSSAYIIYLAIKILKSNSNPNAINDYSINTFKSGMLMQFMNPKTILYGITVTSIFVIPYYKSSIILCLFAIFLSLVGFISMSCWTLFGALFQKILSHHRKLFNIVMASLLVYCALSVPDFKLLIHLFI